MELLWGSVVILFGGVVLGLVYQGIDRKLAARMQARIGPPIVQPFRDIKKLLVKENIVPESAVPWIYNGAPFLALASVVTVLFYLPLGDQRPLFSGYGDLILVLYLLALPAVALAIGGFASGSPYAVIGAQREIVMMMSYELPLAAAIVALAWRLNQALPGIAAFSLGAISSNPVWAYLGPLGFIGAILLVGVLLLVMPAELSKIPFDIAEAETELAGGVTVEYSGRNLALLRLADGVKTVVMGALIIALFFPYRLGGVLGLAGLAGGAVDTAFFLVKLFLIILVGVTTVRVAAARLKVSQVAYSFWVPLTGVALAGLVLIVLDGLFFK
ncbi:MAG: NADH-quinone oxidoreductase subunit H [Candidatus Acetothermia bacterium]|jgi:formate hydrogenlyase subunit 4|nr:NADH-quinone oxidoreductase subunit H [Candidatus Acetothermia bacterium]MDH7505642.1 NADH-quinone oxidoreductase subunit H [Candidatus Acetothermia bacterium]